MLHACQPHNLCITYQSTLPRRRKRWSNVEYVRQRASDGAMCEMESVNAEILWSAQARSYCSICVIRLTPMLTDFSVYLLV